MQQHFCNEKGSGKLGPTTRLLHDTRCPDCQTDTSSEAEVRRLMDTAAPAPDGRLHVLVNNAARFVFGEVTDVTGADWDIALNTNVKG